MKVEINCCEGTELYEGQCLKSRCPLYMNAMKEVENSWPHLATGFGNAHGNPSHGNYLKKVKEKVRTMPLRLDRSDT